MVTVDAVIIEVLSMQQRLDAIQPARAPAKYQATIKLKTAKALGSTVPSLLVLADEVIE
jgi:hypothetical protein